ncbi:MAG: NAD-dependent dihydropyrimidine dehydrogenase subunit PreA [Gammaproteobacteria bacterium]|nr:NAD-dependent dihydropyrimidine dehydrogenase subunit PreA [Gammaproteobacteria bacterium]
MADLAIDMCGIKSPNPFWLASAPPTNTGLQVMRAFEAGWGGAVWKTIGEQATNVYSRFGAVDYQRRKMMGLNNIELVSDRPLETNLKEMREVKKRYPEHALVASLMLNDKEQWREYIARFVDIGVDGFELNFSCPHGMCERGMGSAVGQEPQVITEIVSWVKSFTTLPVLTKLTPNVTDICEPAHAALAGGTDGLALINTIKSIVGLDLETLQGRPNIGGKFSNGGYCGPAVKPIALFMVAALARDEKVGVPISGIGGISNWEDAAEFIALGSTSVQVCTAVMHHGFGIIDGMLSGLSDYLDRQGMQSVQELVGVAVPKFVNWGDLDLDYRVIADINPETCIGCQKCYTACLDGGHQCIHTTKGECQAYHGENDHGMHPRLDVETTQHKKPDGSKKHVPFVNKDECIGCNLCSLICPTGSIEMVEI